MYVPVSSLFAATEAQNMPAQQLLFLSGITLIIGPQKTFYFFARKQKLRGTICFFGGILLVFFKWPFFGVIVETIGFLSLFGYVLQFYCIIPVLTILLTILVISSL